MLIKKICFKYIPVFLFYGGFKYSQKEYFDINTLYLINMAFIGHISNNRVFEEIYNYHKKNNKRCKDYIPNKEELKKFKDSIIICYKTHEKIKNSFHEQIKILYNIAYIPIYIGLSFGILYKNPQNYEIMYNNMKKTIFLYSVYLFENYKSTNEEDFKDSYIMKEVLNDIYIKN